MRNIFANCHVAVAGVTAALLIGAALSGRVVHRTAAASADAAEPIPVTIAAVAMTDVASAIDAGGVVQARTTATITARIVATVREVRVSPGDRVRAGQALVVLDGDDLAAGARAARAAALAADQGAKAAAAELRAAEAGLALARASHDRVAGLEAKRSATAQELDEATATLRSAEARAAGASARALQATSAVESARAAGDQASTTESFTTITAPFDGAGHREDGRARQHGVARRTPSPPGRHSRLPPRGPRGRIAHRPDSERRPHPGLPRNRATTSINGQVVEVSRAVDADARAFLVKIALPDAPGMRSGEFGKARFAGTPRRALTVPRRRSSDADSSPRYSWSTTDVARVRLVSLSESEVLAGLTESEVVILSPPSGVTDGCRVSVGGR